MDRQTFLKNSGIRSVKRYTNAPLLAFYCVFFLFYGCIESGLDKRFPALLMFGDSFADPGNNNKLLTVAKADYPPYGRDLNAGVPLGRFSNGKCSGDFIAGELSIKEYLPAYHDPSLQSDDLLTGVSFASGGSGYDPIVSSISIATTLRQQLDHFKEYKTKLYTLVGENQTNNVMSQAMFGVVASTNDIMVAYYMSGFRRSEYDISSYTSLIATLAAEFYDNLYAEGARRLLILNAPPIGCLPMQRTLYGGLRRDCVEEQNHAAEIFNSKLLSVVESFNEKYTDAKAAIIDFYDPLLNLIKNPTQNGFEVADKGCCGTGMYEAVMLCSQIQTTCSDASRYVFWDSVHPTETTYNKLISLESVLPLFVKN